MAASSILGPNSKQIIYLTSYTSDWNWATFNFGGGGGASPPPPLLAVPMVNVLFFLSKVTGRPAADMRDRYKWSVRIHDPPARHSVVPPCRTFVSHSHDDSDFAVAVAVKF